MKKQGRNRWVLLRIQKHLPLKAEGEARAGGLASMTDLGADQDHRVKFQERKLNATTATRRNI